MKKSLRIPSTLYRTATFDRACIDEEKRTVEMSISTDAPYERYFGKEILDHSPSSIRMDRLTKGAPLLFNHDRNAHIGRIIEATSDGKRLRVKAMFGNSALAKEKWEDVKAGILQETSVGYQVSRMVMEIEDEEEGDTYRVTDWTPFEGSLVTIPADTACGVGRAQENSQDKEILIETKDLPCKQSTSDSIQPTQTTTMATETAHVPAPKVTIDPTSERNAAVAEFKQRCQKIDNYVAGLKNPQWQSKAAEIAIKHKSGDAIFEDFRAEALDNFEGLTRIATEPTIGMDKRDLSKYSLVRAISCLSRQGGRLDGLEKECSDAAAKLNGKETQGFFIPQDVMEHRALTTNVFSAAGALVQAGPQGQSLIELYRNKMQVVALGARVLTGLQGNLAIPSQTGGATAAWLSENGTITASDQSVGQVSLTPHRLVGATAFTYQLLAQSSIDVENFVRNDLMTVLAIEKDRAALKGSGTNGEPLGIYLTGGKSTSVTLAGANSMTYANAVQFETNVATNNADLGSLGYLTSVATKGNAKLVAEISSANSIPVWKNDMVNGYTARATNQLTTLPSVIFGNWSDLIIGDWAANEVIVDPYSLSMQGQVRIVMQQLSDVAIRHPKSFSISTT